MSLSKGEKKGNIFEKALTEYLRLLQRRPVVTKAVTNALVSGLGTIISQLIVKDSRAKGRIYWRSVFAYMSFGLIVSGPITHHLYAFMEKYFPREKKYSSLKRLLFDRLVFAPPFLLAFLYYVSIAEGSGHDAAMEKLKQVYWMILKLNWTVWSVVQYITVNYIPLKFRTLFGNLCGLVWMIFLSVKRRQATA
ncbi:peroxisomal membrane protein 2-like [Pomacea canaliculata]|uniref:peroxisomal membrane protein 2-like n=1 Tax=Pomacea canaliculata TaxID=400727 RepID=UPI000D73CD41|nr:peroxisomal membrane protein 2-like [Pomacea canaliculata]